MVINGFLNYDDDDLVGISETKNPKLRWKEVKSILELLKNEFGYKEYDGEYYLGGTKILVPDVSMRIYYTDKECTLEEAESALLDKMYGTLTVEASLTGYSEYTITGLEITTFTLGNHDIITELESNIGKYCWIIIEECDCEENN